MLVYSPEKIVTLREQRGWNQAELARRAELSQPSVWALERGETRMPKFETLESVARALGVPIKDILAERPKGKGGEEWDEQLAAAYAGLSDDNKVAVAAVIRSLLSQQKSS